MRRSVREAIVGFSLIAAVSSAVGFSFWLRGLSLARDTWRLGVSFGEAAGLAERSPVVFRGVLIGHVRRVQVTPQAVLAQLEITSPDLRLAKPVIAQIGEATLLGGEAQVQLIPAAKSLPPSTPLPSASNCDPALMLCDGSQIKGVTGASLDSVTALMQKLLQQGDREQLVSKFATLAQSLNQTSTNASLFINDGRQLVRNLDGTVSRVQPAIDNLNATTAESRRLVAALNNPKTLQHLQNTLSNAEQLTARLNAVGSDINKLSSDPKVMEGIRSVSIGLGRFFDELYPGQIDGARQKPAPNLPGPNSPTPNSSAFNSSAHNSSAHNSSSP
jgi:phospholipid/cholesterol/gamma-HCH transport system substrate-binding protein